MAANTPFETELSNFTLQDAIYPISYRDAIETAYKEPNARDLFHRLNRVYGLIANYTATGHLGSKEYLYSSTKNSEHVYTHMRVGTYDFVGDFGNRYIEPEAFAIYEILEKCAECLRDYTEENAERLNKNLLNITQSADNGAQKEQGVSWLGSEAEQKRMIYQHIKKSIMEIQQELMNHYPKLSLHNRPSSSSSSSIQTEVEPSQLKSLSTELPPPAESAGSNENIQTHIQRTEEKLKNCEITSTEDLFYEREERRREKERQRRNQLECEAKIASYSANIADAIHLLASRDKDARNYYACALYPRFLKKAQEEKDGLCYLQAYKKLACIELYHNPKDIERPKTYVEYAKAFLNYIKDKDTKDIWEELINRLLPDLPENAPASADPAIPALRSLGMLKAPPSPSHTDKPILRPFSRATLGQGK